MTHKFSFELSPTAVDDISAIDRYTMQRYGAQQAETYVRGLEKQLHFIADTPHIGKNRDEIKVGLRSFVYKKHIIFYRIKDTCIRITNVLNVNRDALHLLEKDEQL